MIGKTLLSILTLSLFLGACNSKADADSPTQSLGDIQTMVVMTITAQAFQLPTGTLVPTASLTTAPTMTAILFPTYFAPTSTSFTNASGCYNSTFVSDVTIPDDTCLVPEESFTKTWRLYNNGTCTWDADFSIVFVSGDNLSGATTLLDQVVYSGSTADISVDMIAPDMEGSYTGYWQLINAAGIAFGEKVYVQIIVSYDAATSTPTSTATSTTAASTSTPTSTSTPVPTDTPLPTETPTTPPEATPAP